MERTGTEVGTSGRPPRSWAEDLNTYRSSRGGRSYATLDQTSAPARFSRTNYVPFCDTRHALFPYNDFVDGQDTIRVDRHVASERFARHGWGDTTLLKEDGYAGTLHPRGGGDEPRGGKAIVPSPASRDGRTGLFGVLQGTEAGGADSWIGHGLIEPTKGKRTMQPPPDPKGRRDLFDVLHVRNPGVPADDSWLGHALIDPAKGKGNAPGPEQTRGRRDLSDIFAMAVLHDPHPLELLQKGADPLGDAWCGHALIDPARGKLPVSGAPASQEHLSGATFKPDAKGDDFPKRHTKTVPPPVPDTANQLLAMQPGGDDWGRLSKKRFTDMPAPNPYDGRKDLYAHMTFKSLSEVETAKYARAMDDAGAKGKRVVPVPGSTDPGKGPDLLAWRPEVRVGTFVPRGGMAQENRIKGSTLRGRA